jgi:hypothetical protein
MESVIKLCLKAMTRLNQTQSKLLNTICQKQEKPLGTTLHGKDTEHGHHARPKVRRTPWRVDATRRSPLSYPAVEGSV